jgi:hypothetical protein
MARETSSLTTVMSRALHEPGKPARGEERNKRERRPWRKSVVEWDGKPVKNAPTNGGRPRRHPSLKGYATVRMGFRRGKQAGRKEQD